MEHETAMVGHELPPREIAGGRGIGLEEGLEGGTQLGGRGAAMGDTDIGVWIAGWGEGACFNFKGSESLKISTTLTP
jgi:hypothetical protein